MTNTITVLEADELAFIDLSDATRNPTAVYIGKLTSAHSQRNMLRHLNVIAEWLTSQKDFAYLFQWGVLRYAHTARIRAILIESGDYGVNTINTMLSALRGVLKEAWRLGYMTAEDYQRAVDIENVKGNSLPTGRDLAPVEISTLVEGCMDGSKAGQRDAAIIGIMYVCGLRRSEVVKLNVADFAPGTGKLAIHSAKGNKSRSVFAQGGALDALLDWMHIRGWEAGPLFLPILKNQKIVMRRLDAQTIYDILQKRAEKLGLTDFSPHDFRRTFVGDMLERGVDIATVAKIAGHASVDTTQRYDRRPEETKREAAAKLHYPYRKQGHD